MSIGQHNMPAGPITTPAIAKSEGLVSDYPLSSVLVVFGIGLGIGVALGSILGGPPTPRPSIGRRTELAAQHLGRQVLDGLVSVLPESLSKHVSA